MSGLLDQLRFAPEKESVARIMQRFNIERLISQFEESGGLKSYRELFLATQLKVSCMISPRLWNLLAEVRRVLEFEPNVDLFILADPSINAGAVYSLDDRPHIVSLTSSMIERMNDAELRFVLGHEIGHLCYQHYRARLTFQALGEEGRSRMPTLLMRQLNSWSRLAEISADRAGFAATNGELQQVVSAFFKTESRLGPEHLCFDINAFLQQLQELQQSDRRAFMYGFSHPITPIRVRALQLFGAAGGIAASAAGLVKVDQEVTNLATLMEFEAEEPRDVHARDFILAGGVLAAHADGKAFNQQEFEMLVEWLLPVIPDPEAAIATITSFEQAQEMLNKTAAWLRENAGEDRYGAYRMVVGIAAVDGEMSENEEKFFMGVAELLAIPPKEAKDNIYQILAKCVKSAQPGAPFGQNFNMGKPGD